MAFRPGCFRCLLSVVFVCTMSAAVSAEQMTSTSTTEESTTMLSTTTFFTTETSVTMTTGNITPVTAASGETTQQYRTTETTQESTTTAVTESTETTQESTTTAVTESTETTQESTTTAGTESTETTQESTTTAGTESTETTQESTTTAGTESTETTQESTTTAGTESTETTQKSTATAVTESTETTQESTVTGVTESTGTTYESTVTAVTESTETTYESTVTEGAESTTDEPCVCHTCVSSSLSYCEATDPLSEGNAASRTQYTGHRGLETCQHDERCGTILVTSARGVLHRYIRRCVAGCVEGAEVACDDVVSDMYADPTYSGQMTEQGYYCTTVACHCQSYENRCSSLGTTVGCTECTGTSWEQCEFGAKVVPCNTTKSVCLERVGQSPLDVAVYSRSCERLDYCTSRGMTIGVPKTATISGSVVTETCQHADCIEATPDECTVDDPDTPACRLCSATTWRQCDEDAVITTCNQTAPICLMWEHYNGQDLLSVSRTCGDLVADIFMTLTEFANCKMNSTQGERTCVTSAPPLDCGGDVGVCPRYRPDPVCLVCTGSTKEACDSQGTPTVCTARESVCVERSDQDSRGVERFSRRCEQMDYCTSKNMSIGETVTTEVASGRTSETCYQTRCSDGACLGHVCMSCDVAETKAGEDASVLCQQRAVPTTCSDDEVYCRVEADIEPRAGHFVRFKRYCATREQCTNVLDGVSLQSTCVARSDGRGSHCTVCEKRICEVDDCESNLCQNGASCIDDGLNRYRCKCRPFYSGRFCENYGCDIVRLPPRSIFRHRVKFRLLHVTMNTVTKRMKASVFSTLEVIYGCQCEATKHIFIGISGISYKPGSVWVEANVDLSTSVNSTALSDALLSGMDNFVGLYVDPGSVEAESGVEVREEAVIDILPLILGTVAGVVVLCLIVIIVLYWVHRKKLKRRYLEERSFTRGLYDYQKPTQYGSISVPTGRHWRDVPSMRAANFAEVRASTGSLLPPLGRPKTSERHAEIDWSILRQFSNLGASRGFNSAPSEPSLPRQLPFNGLRGQPQNSNRGSEWTWYVTDTGNGAESTNLSPHGATIRSQRDM